MNYRDYLIKKKLSKNTIEGYIYDLDLFTSFLGNRDLNSAEKMDIVKYLIYLKNKGYSNKTIARKVAALKSYFYYALNTGVIGSDPTFGLEGPKVDRTSKGEIKPREVIDKFIKLPIEINNYDLKSLRDYLIFKLTFLTAINITDLLDKKLIDLNLDLGCFNDGRDYVFLEDEVVEYGKKYLALLTGSYPDNDYLFVNLYGDKLSRQGAWKVFKSYSHILGEDITPQILINTSKYYN